MPSTLAEYVRCEEHDGARGAVQLPSHNGNSAGLRVSRDAETIVLPSYTAVSNRRSVLIGQTTTPKGAALFGRSHKGIVRTRVMQDCAMSRNELRGGGANKGGCGGMREGEIRS